MTVMVNVPQIIAAICVLSPHWDDNEGVCDEAHRVKWRWWSAFATVRMFVFVILTVILYRQNPRGGRRQDADPSENSWNAVVVNARNGVDMLGLIWFVVGNMWLFGSGSTATCPNGATSPIYNLCMAMLLINYIQICLPCIVGILLIPVLCLCLPCVIRLLARLQDPMDGKGATRAAIDSLQTCTFREGMEIPLMSGVRRGGGGAGGGVNSGPSSTSVSGLESGDAAACDEMQISCAICLSEYTEGEELRLLPCSHTFHKSCVDEWLMVNATCPNCRGGIEQSPAGGGDGGASGSEAAAQDGVGSINDASGRRRDTPALLV